MDIVRDSVNFLYIFGWKQKLQLSKMKSAILQLNTRYYVTALPKMRIKLIVWN